MPQPSPKRFARRRLIALAAGVAGLGLALPVLAQRSPEPLLPPGFGAPAAPAPAPAQAAPQNPATPAPQAPAAPPPGAADASDLLPSLALDANAIDNASADAGADNAAEAERLRKLELPDWARRPLDMVGPLDASRGGLDAAAFGGGNGANGRWLAGLMQRLDAPIASRWGSILLRRALLTPAPTPRAVPAADWVAARAGLLLRMGEADAARMLVQGVDVENYSPALYAVALQTALATADPAALCPLVGPQANPPSGDPNWTYARGLCAALGGDSGAASALFDQARKRSRPIDYLLAERVAGAASNSRRSITIEWSGTYELTSWRFGMASAVGLAIPDSLYGSAGRQVRAWGARAPMLSLADRLDNARIAATLGVFSNATLVDIYSQLFDAGDPNATDSDAARLRLAYVGRDPAARLDAFRALWNESDAAGGRYANAVLLARAAARIAPGSGGSDDAARLIAAMLAAGLDIQATRWAPLVAKDDEAWALLSVGAPRPVMTLDAKRIAGFGAREGSDQRKRARLLYAGLAGLGRLADGDEGALAAELGVPIGARNAWTNAIDGAAARGQAGTVALLAAVGLQSGGWRGIPAFQLFHIVAALKRVGLEPEARMIAAEAISRT